MNPTWLIEYQNEINTSIERFFYTRYRNSLWVESDFEQALQYAVEWGGKRVRPILALLAYEYFWGKNTDKKYTDRSCILDCLIGLEYIHAYTLVHDDLPCMDNDEIRRGKPTVWKAYGETMAILVGDALQTMGFEALSSLWESRIILEIARALGDLGVVRGQARDTLLLQKNLTLDELLRLHDEKTGVFIASSLVIWAILGWADDREIEKIRSWWILLGRAFQIADDILDYEWDDTIVGKKTGKDVELGKWIVAILWIENTKKLLEKIEKELQDIEKSFSHKKFQEIQDFIIKRAS